MAAYRWIGAAALAMQAALPRTAAVHHTMSPAVAQLSSSPADPAARPARSAPRSARRDEINAEARNHDIARTSRDNGSDCQEVLQSQRFPQSAATGRETVKPGGAQPHTSGVIARGGFSTVSGAAGRAVVRVDRKCSETMAGHPRLKECSMTHKTRIIVATAVLLTLLAASCGTDPSPDAAPQPSAAEAPTPADTAPDEPPLADPPAEAPSTTAQPAPAPTRAEPESTTTTTTTAAGDDPTSETTEPATEDAAEPPAVTEPEPEPVEEPDPAPDPAVEPEQDEVESEPEAAPEASEEPTTTTVAPEPEQQQPDDDAIVCVRGADGVPACPEVVPEDYLCEGTDDGMTCRPPGAEPEPEPETEPESETAEQPEPATGGDIVCSRLDEGVVSCPQDVPEDYWCENTDDGMICHPPDTPKPEPETVVVDEADDWTPPEAGMVPEVHPDVPLYEWQQSGWQRPDERINDKPRPTAMVVGWTNWCYNTWLRGGCNQLLHYMKQALDYLGAHPQCVFNMYTERVKYLADQGAGADRSYAKNSFGWHLCATVIDPIAFGIPAEGRDNDVGLRLSDTPGITLAERCRIVLTTPFPDIQLEAGTSSYRIEAGIPTTRFGQDCDAWATWIIENGPVRSSPACNESSSLAEEWMEHNHNQHERYFSPHC